jgi:hypothetical protein
MGVPSPVGPGNPYPSRRVRVLTGKGKGMDGDTRGSPLKITTRRRHLLVGIQMRL